jgi:hypothetical protein
MLGIADTDKLHVGPNAFPGQQIIENGRRLHLIVEEDFNEMAGFEA